MTEPEWLACEDIEELLGCVVREMFPDAEPCDWGGGERKKRLFLCACVRRVWHLIPAEYRAAFETMDPDIRVSEEARRARYSAAEALSWEHADLLFAIDYDDIGLACWVIAGLTDRTTEDHKGFPPNADRRLREALAQVSLLRDVFGNPFHAVSVNQSWHSPNVSLLAQAAYEERIMPSGELEPARLAVLADELEETCCGNDDILGHLRSPGPHVRGCWAVDLLLGKE